MENKENDKHFKAEYYISKTPLYLRSNKTDKWYKWYSDIENSCNEFQKLNYNYKQLIESYKWNENQQETRNAEVFNLGKKISIEAGEYEVFKLSNLSFQGSKFIDEVVNEFNKHIKEGKKSLYIVSYYQHLANYIFKNKLNSEFSFIELSKVFNINLSLRLNLNDIKRLLIEKIDTFGESFKVHQEMLVFIFTKAMEYKKTFYNEVKVEFKVLEEEEEKWNNAKFFNNNINNSFLQYDTKFYKQQGNKVRFFNSYFIDNETPEKRETIKEYRQEKTSLFSDKEKAREYVEQRSLEIEKEQEQFFKYNWNTILKNRYLQQAKKWVKKNKENKLVLAEAIKHMNFLKFYNNLLNEEETKMFKNDETNKVIKELESILDRNKSFKNVKEKLKQYEGHEVIRLFYYHLEGNWKMFWGKATRDNRSEWEINYWNEPRENWIDNSRKNQVKSQENVWGKFSIFQHSFELFQIQMSFLDFHNNIIGYDEVKQVINIRTNWEYRKRGNNQYDEPSFLNLNNVLKKEGNLIELDAKKIKTIEKYVSDYLKEMYDVIGNYYSFFQREYKQINRDSIYIIAEKLNQIENKNRDVPFNYQQSKKWHLYDNANPGDWDRKYTRIHAWAYYFANWLLWKNKSIDNVEYVEDLNQRYETSTTGVERTFNLLDANYNIRDYKAPYELVFEGGSYIDNFNKQINFKNEVKQIDIKSLVFKEGTFQNDNLNKQISNQAKSILEQSYNLEFDNELIKSYTNSQGTFENVKEVFDLKTLRRISNTNTLKRDWDNFDNLIKQATKKQAENKTLRNVFFEMLKEN